MRSWRSVMSTVRDKLARREGARGSREVQDVRARIWMCEGETSQ
jgi:hypothetical protein